MSFGTGLDKGKEAVGQGDHAAPLRSGSPENQAGAAQETPGATLPFPGTDLRQMLQRPFGAAGSLRTSLETPAMPDHTAVADGFAQHILDALRAQGQWKGVNETGFREHFKMIWETAVKLGEDPIAALSQVYQESNFNSHARSWVGARNLMQIMPTTAPFVAHLMHARGIEVSAHQILNDPKINVEAGLIYMQYLRQRCGGDETLALASYNAGYGNVHRYHGVPPFRETRNYVAAIHNRTLALASVAEGLDAGPALASVAPLEWKTPVPTQPTPNVVLDGIEKIRKIIDYYRGNLSQGNDLGANDLPSSPSKTDASPLSLQTTPEGAQQHSTPEQNTLALHEAAPPRIVQKWFRFRTSRDDQSEDSEAA